VQKVTDPLGNVTTLAYSPAADLAAVTDALGNSVEFQRDLVGRLQRVTDAVGASTFSEYNRARPGDPKITDANSGVTSFSYDAKRDPTAVVDPLGRAVESYVSDDMHRLTRRTDAKGGVETYDYDSASRLLAATDRKGQRVSLEYDRQNRVTSITYAGGGTETARLRRRRPARCSIRDGVGTIAFDYDELDRVVRETTDVGGLVNTVEYRVRRPRPANPADGERHRPDDLRLRPRLAPDDDRLPRQDGGLRVGRRLTPDRQGPAQRHPPGVRLRPGQPARSRSASASPTAR
jgi:YD repeat-containing protein